MITLANYLICRKDRLDRTASDTEGGTGMRLSCRPDFRDDIGEGFLSKSAGWAFVNSAAAGKAGSN